MREFVADYDEAAEHAAVAAVIEVWNRDKEIEERIVSVSAVQRHLESPIPAREHKCSSAPRRKLKSGTGAGPVHR